MQKKYYCPAHDDYKRPTPQKAEEEGVSSDAVQSADRPMGGNKFWIHLSTLPLGSCFLTFLVGQAAYHNPLPHRQLP